MIDKQIIFEIHRLFHHQGWSKSRVASHLRLSRETVKRYLVDPLPRRGERKKRKSKLDPWKQEIRDILKKEDAVSAQVIFQHLRKKGYEGGVSILRDYVQGIRDAYRKKKAYLRYESPPGMQGQVDWGHFGTLQYGKEKRKLYCFSLVECHSRLLYLEFTHSMRLETFLRCHVHAFQFFNGVMHDLVYDNLPTAVTEHVGRFIRFHDRFFDFARHYDFNPRACNKGAGHEKGKIEAGGIRYIRYNFFPLRKFKDLADANRQARAWRDEIANRRIHQTTRERPVERFQPEALRPLPPADFQTLDTQSGRVHKDLRLQFDANRYCVPPRYVGKRLMVKADAYHVSLFDREKHIITYPRCWGRHLVIGAKKFEKILLRQRQEARLHKGVENFCSLGEVFRDYLSRISRNHPSVCIQRELDQLNRLVSDYGDQAIEEAIRHARPFGAYGAEYLENILIQRMTPENKQPRVVLKVEALNKLLLERPRMEEYDSIALMERGKRHGRDQTKDDETPTQDDEG